MQYKLVTVLLLLLLPMSVIAVFSMDSSATKTMIINANAQIGRLPQRVLPTYIIRISPGAALQSSPIHCSSHNVAIPSGNYNNIYKQGNAFESENKAFVVI